MSEHFKALISEEEAIRALIKESKLKNRRFQLENERIRPNVKFLQRTVSNIVTNNNKITLEQNSFKSKHSKGPSDNCIIIGESEEKAPKRKLMLPQDIMPINFIKSTVPFKSMINPNKLINVKKKTIHKINFVSEGSEILEDNSQKVFVNCIENNSFIDIKQQKSFDNSVVQFSEEEVGKTLHEGSTLKNGKFQLENERIRPNVNFLQRTVSNIVTNNNKITHEQNSFKSRHCKEPSDNCIIIEEPKEKTPKRKLMLPQDIMPIKFIKSTLPFKSMVNPNKLINVKKKTIHKVNFVSEGSESLKKNNSEKVFVNCIENNSFVDIKQKKSFDDSVANKVWKKVNQRKTVQKNIGSGSVSDQETDIINVQTEASDASPAFKDCDKTPTKPETVSDVIVID